MPRFEHIVEQDHRAIKRLTKPMSNFKSFRSAGFVLAGIDLIHMIKRVNSQSTAPMLCRSPINFLRWQTGPSSLRGGVPYRRIPSFNQQRDRTLHMPCDTFDRNIIPTKVYVLMGECRSRHSKYRRHIGEARTRFPDAENIIDKLYCTGTATVPTSQSGHSASFFK